MKVSSIESIARVLNDAKVPFVVVGGVAVVAHGYGRQTQDLDLVMPLDPGTLRRAVAALGTLGFHPRIPVTVEDLADPDTRERWYRDHGMVVLAFHSEQHAETPIDLFVHEPFDVMQEHSLAAVAEVAPGVPMHILRLAALLAMKRSAGREQDRADVAELSRLHGLDHA